ncbi:hypothetical protein [Flavobacterium sp. C4GT6]|uniref:hypothetical protein n=1 Tax=Flavobacterium sp. C4GT6 TaxID=3103818 RepID=UPI002ED0D0C9
MKIVFYLLSLFLLSCNCNDALQEKGKLELKEASGIEYIHETGKLWVLEDSGNKNSLYSIDENGKTEKKLKITNAKNKDWEDLTSDKEGNIYIGDFGNNDNDRKDLAIYRIDKEELEKKEAKSSYKVSFYYPEQNEFPPKRSKMLFDVEAFFELNGNFYLFTKNRSAKFDGTFFVYKVPNKEGEHAAQRIAELNSCKVYSKCAITAADISSDGKTVVLLSSDKVWLITDFENDNFKQENMTQYPLGHMSQKEGICFKDKYTLYIVDEKDSKAGGYLYEVGMERLLKSE